MAPGSKTSPAITEQDDPSPNQNIQQRGRIPTPPKKAKKAWLYDCEDKSLTIQDPEDLEKSEKTFDKIPLGKGQKEIVLFIDTGSESISTSGKDKSGYCNAPLAILILNQAGLWNNLLRILGRIPMLYVQNSSLWSETKSIQSSE
ncbi:MAG: hypothetical protein Q9227_006252 [Pyrenula ochraceoflavens]